MLSRNRAREIHDEKGERSVKAEKAKLFSVVYFCEDIKKTLTTIL